MNQWPARARPLWAAITDREAVRPPDERPHGSELQTKSALVKLCFDLWEYVQESYLTVIVLCRPIFWGVGSV